jgi:hypothetical protein
MGEPFKVSVHIKAKHPPEHMFGLRYVKLFRLTGKEYSINHLIRLYRIPKAFLEKL